MSGELAAWPDRLERAAAGTCFRKIRVHSECASTQEPARALGPGAVVTTGRQTAGRGRQGRTWEDGEGRSVSVSLAVEADSAARLSTASALGVLDAVEGLYGGNNFDLGVKFPNDLVHRDGRKFAGILVEADDQCAVIGIGINVHVRSWPSEYRAASLDELGIACERLELLEALLPAVAGRLNSDDASLARDYGKRHLPSGRNVVIEFERERLEGRLEGIDPFGMLELHAQSGIQSIPVAHCRMLEWGGDASP